MSAKYAIVTAFGQQFKVQEGDKIKTNFVGSDTGSKLSFDVLLLSNNGQITVGQPKVAGAKVNATVETHGRDKKILVFKYLRKSRSKKLHGHKQPFSVLNIDSIEV